MWYASRLVFDHMYARIWYVMSYVCTWTTVCLWTSSKHETDDTDWPGTSDRTTDSLGSITAHWYITRLGALLAWYMDRWTMEFRISGVFVDSDAKKCIFSDLT